MLQAFRRGKNLQESYRSVGVDRNTICSGAAIVELSVVCPTKFEELLSGYGHGDKLMPFIQKCRDVIKHDPTLIQEVENQKKSGRLLPIKNK